MSVIAVDAMGGDHAPVPEVHGAVAAVRGHEVEVVLVGDESALRQELGRVGGADLAGITIRHATEVVTMDDHPGRVFRTKRDSSMRVAFDLVKDGVAAAVVSAGNSGAMLGHGLFVLGRVDGVERPGIVSVLPTRAGTLVLCDTGANVEVKPSMLAQFGILGAHYDRIAHGHARPRVGLLSNGTEASKGTELTRAAHEILLQVAAHPEVELEYLGYVEGSSLFSGEIDVVATDGFTGNVVLKLAEGLAEAMVHIVADHLQHSGDVRSGLAGLSRAVDYRERGGALLGGVKGVVMICHGRSDAVAIENAIRAADTEVKGGLVERLAGSMARHGDLWDALRAEGTA
jgi:glycerol-3-phosphate acyltransferase PlsX